MSLTRYVPALIAWIGLVAHLVVGIVALRRSAGSSLHSLLPLLNLAVAVCVLAYWARVWYGYVARGVTWYVSDQLMPLYALAVVVASALALAGRYDGRALHWIIFAIDALALAGAALYLTFANFSRLF
jgi:hypothetical protein